MTVRRLGLAAAYWAGSIRRRADSEAPTLLLCAVLLFGIWSIRSANPWAVEHQTNIAGKDVIVRCRDKSFCPIPDDPDNDGSSLVDTDI